MPLIAMLYYEGADEANASQILAVDEARVRQVHETAIRRLSVELGLVEERHRPPVPEPVEATPPPPPLRPTDEEIDELRRLLGGG
jgi:hypothetical protein